MTLQLSRPDADIFVPDGLPMPAALARATHLAIGAHQDDLEIMAFHGIARCFGRGGRGFAGVVVTDGSGSPRAGRYAGVTNEDMTRIRAGEQRKAAVVGEYACQLQLMHPSAQVRRGGPDSPVVADLHAILSAVRPEILYIHNPTDRHDTHVALCLRTVEALRRLPRDRRPARVLGCEVWRDLDWLVDADKVALPVGELGNLASALTGVFDSQITGGKRYDLAAAGRRLAHATFFESHAVDATGGLTFAVDMTALIADDSLSVADFAARLVRRLGDDVADRIRRAS